MELLVELDLGELRLRTLTVQDEDAALLVEATRAESAPSLWGPRPAGPYSLAAARSALQAWDPHQGRQVSFGVLDGRCGRKTDVAASRYAASRPSRPGRTPPQASPGSGWRSILPTRRRSGSHNESATAWNSAYPATAALGAATTQHTTPGTTASSGFTPPDGVVRPHLLRQRVVTLTERA